MCAIAGLMGTDDPGALARVEEMLRVQHHRGPDGSAVLQDKDTVIGHCRLAILGLGNAGRQPMTSRDGRWSIVFNGEIFNYIELRGDLERSFCGGLRSGTDTEILLEGIAAWGIECTLRRSAGMFALAVWDGRERELTLARDRLGEKPLVYFRDREILAFASELKALRDFHGGRLEPLAVDAYLALGYIPAPLAIFRGCKKLEPGQLLRMKQGGEPRVSRWQVAESAVDATGDQQTALRERVGEAVRQRLRADVPIALSLSGGVDSSIIAAECVRHGKSPEAFTVRLEQESGDVEAARAVARHLGLRHHVLEESGFGHGIERMVRHYDEPFADSSAIPSLALAQALAGRYKVVLNGDGGDEVFGGYRHYEHFQIKRVLKTAAAAVGICDGGKAGWAGAYVQSKAMFRATERGRFLNGHGMGNSLDGLTFSTLPGRALEAGMWIDRHLALANGLNYKTDIAYGAFGIEGRAPFLDHRLGKWAAGLRPEELVRGREKKTLLRAAYAGDLPVGVLNRPKQGFGAPLGQWLRGPLRELAGDLMPSPLLDRELQKRRSGQQLWTLLAFAQWAREWRASW
ncbi:MAG TPA: asparagine synthase (glutamine-hydrolyzing) [Bryobacteraceae bacterium]|nr:asparagine synthase (glutamine-hydrolyzing) [Bryobacteraceae bacterium]